MNIKTKYNLGDTVYYLHESRNKQGSIKFVKCKVLEIKTKSTNIINYNGDISFEQSIKYRLNVENEVQSEERTAECIEKDPINLIKNLLNNVPENSKLSLSDLTKI